MPSLRTGIALLQALALGSTFFVWCPCPAGTTAAAAADTHACCRKGELAVRSAGHACCQPCHALSASSDAEPVPSVRRADTVVVAPAFAAAAFQTTVAAHFLPAFLSASPPPLSPGPLRL